MPSKAVMDKVSNAEAPFNNVDLIIVTHAHAEHYDIQMIGKVMEKNPNAFAVISKEVNDLMKTQYTGYTGIQARIYQPAFPYFAHKDTTIAGIPMIIHSIMHSGSMQFLTFNILMDSIRFLHLVTPNTLTDAQFDTVAFNTHDFDVAFLANTFITTKIGLTRNSLHPKYISLMHVENIVTAKAAIQTTIVGLKNEFKITLPTSGMEVMRFTRSNNTIKGDTLNTAPVVSGKIRDTNIYVDKTFKLSISKDLFTDAQTPSTLTYSALLTNGKALPSWLSFDPASLTFSGTPTLADTIASSIKVVATDPSFADVPATFKITVKKVLLGIKSQKLNSFKIYPNPASGLIHVVLDNPSGLNNMLRVFNMEGKLVLKKAVGAATSVTLDMSNYKGVFVVKYNDCSQKVTLK
jgi:hypothetical protein